MKAISEVNRKLPIIPVEVENAINEAAKEGKLGIWIMHLSFEARTELENLGYSIMTQDPITCWVSWE